MDQLYFFSHPGAASLNLILALVPAVLWIWLFYKKFSFNLTAKSLIFVAFIFGWISTIPTALLYSVSDHLLGLFISKAPLYPIESGFAAANVLFWLFYFLFVNGPIEEYSKYLMVRYTLFKTPYFTRPIDGIVFGMIVGLGFAFVENILYMQWYGREVIILRSVFAMMGHCLYGMLWGYALGLAKVRKSMKIDRKWLWGAMALHGISNFIISCGVFIFELITIPVFFVVFSLMLKNFRQYKAAVGFGRSDTARTSEHLGIAVRNDPDNILLLNEYSFYLLKENRLGEVDRVCNHILEIKFTDPRVRYLMAYVRVLRSEFARAGSLYKEAFMYDRHRLAFEEAFLKLDQYYERSKDDRCLPLLLTFSKLGSDRTREMKYLSRMNAKNGA